jgi:hypothetical protein
MSIREFQQGFFIVSTSTNYLQHVSTMDADGKMTRPKKVTIGLQGLELVFGDKSDAKKR